MSSSLKPICVECRCFYRPKKNGYMFLEGMPNCSPVARSVDKLLRPDQIRGNRFPDAWSPYKLWRGDLWECPDCGHQIVSGVAMAPFAEHYQLNFNQMLEEYPPQIQVNDC